MTSRTTATRRYRIALAVALAGLVVGGLSLWLSRSSAPETDAPSRSSSEASTAGSADTAAADELQETEVRQVAAFTPDGEVSPDVEIIDVAEATCNASKTSFRSDAMWCHTATWSFDPCFAFDPVVPDPAVCMKDPWENQVVLVEVVGGSGPYWDESNFIIDPSLFELPFAIEMEEGLECWFTTGMTWFAPGSVVTHHCDGGDVLVAPIDRSEDVWRVRVWSTDASGMDWRRIAIAFF